MKQIFSFIEANSDVAVELECGLTKIPAVSPDSGGEGELDKCEFLEAFLKKRGFSDFERIDIPDARAKGGVRPNLIVTIPGENTQALWLVTHLDVVPPGEAKLWHSDPWEAVVKDGKIYGRGVEDNQQGLVSSVLAALTLLKNNIKPLYTLKLLFVSDEECGNGYGIDALIKRDAERAAQGLPTVFNAADMALIPDGGDPAGESIEIAEKHIVWLKLTTLGVQTHGSRPDEGANAFLAASCLAFRLHHDLSGLFNEQDDLFTPPYSTFEPTKKEANVPNVNTIPGEDVFYMDMRILPRYSVQQVLAEVQDIIDEVQKTYQVTVSYEIVQQTESKPTSRDAPLVVQLSKTLEIALGVKGRPIGIGGGTAGAFLRNTGIDAVVWSKMDDTAHSPNEYTVIDNILDGAKVMALLAAPRFLSPDR